MSLWWFEQLARPGAATTSSPPTSPSEVRGRAVICERLDMYPVECVARGYLTGSGLLDYRATGDGVRHRAARRARGRQPAARADLHAGDQGRPGRARRERVVRRRRRRRSAPSAATELRELTLRGLRPGRGASPGSAASSWPTPSSSSARRGDGTVGARRRGADPGLVAVLAGRRVAARAARSRRTTSRSCATGCCRRSPAGTAPPVRPHRRCRRRSSSAPGRATSRPTSCSPAQTF